MTRIAPLRTGLPAVILAGGQGRRMGGVPKGLLPLGSGCILDEILRRLTPQVAPILINIAPGDGRYVRFGSELLADPEGLAGQGPLAGLLAALDWAARRGHDRIATVPVDTPFLPHDLLARLTGVLADDVDVAYAISGARDHPVTALWRTGPADRLRQALTEGDCRRMAGWISTLRAASVRFDDSPYDPFFNVNTPEDLAEAERIAAQAR